MTPQSLNEPHKVSVYSLYSFEVSSASEMNDNSCQNQSGSYIKRRFMVLNPKLFLRLYIRISIDKIKVIFTDKKNLPNTRNYKF